ncbi:hypothetical protein [Propionivibrio sp.]|uniref:hypothetical protein n=1 Tax=Propionivibrio sp. TaxID=2212460 RepID=UPI0039E36A86
MIVGERVRALAARLPAWLERIVLAVVCWQLAGLVWWVFAPGSGGPQPVAARAAPARVDSREALIGWFGAEAKADAAAASEYALMAVIAGRNGAALFRGSDGKSLAVRTGEALDASSRLIAVEPGGAIIERGGVRQEIKLPQAEARPLFGRPGGAPAPAAPASASAPKAAVLKPIRLTHGQMVAVMRGGNVAGWDTGLSGAPDGGIRLDRVAAQPFAVLLQLKDGDVLKKVNRRPLERVADVSLLFFHFGQQPSVNLELIRRGVPLIQHYDIQP